MIPHTRVARIKYLQEKQIVITIIIRKQKILDPVASLVLNTGKITDELLTSVDWKKYVVIRPKGIMNNACILIYQTTPDYQPPTHVILCRIDNRRSPHS